MKKIELQEMDVNENMSFFELRVDADIAPSKYDFNDNKTGWNDSDAYPGIEDLYDKLKKATGIEFVRKRSTFTTGDNSFQITVRYRSETAPVYSGIKSVGENHICIFVFLYENTIYKCKVDFYKNLGISSDKAEANITLKNSELNIEEIDVEKLNARIVTRINELLDNYRRKL